MTDLQKLRAQALAACKLPAEGQHKRFIRDMADTAKYRPEHPLSAAQAGHIVRLSWRYRKQMPAHLVPAQDPDTVGQANVTEEEGQKE